MWKFSLLDGRSGGAACITKRGQLVTSPIDFSESHAVTADAADTAFNFISPKAGKRFVITDILLDAGKSVSASTAGTIVIYESTTATGIVAAVEILTVEMLKNTNRVITGLNLISAEGNWISLQTTDATVFGTLLGYYVDA